MAEELRRRGYYKQILTEDYMKNLCMSAPMHDIGKISIPDAILKKPGKLSEEKFAIMKNHTENGGRIVEETFGNLRNEQYARRAYQVPCFHHEKWNGNGYPDGISGKENPICARIMAVADVFEAVSEKRCYRDSIASLYFSKRLNIVATALTVAGVSAGQVLAFYMNTLQDENFTQFHTNECKKAICTLQEFDKSGFCGKESYTDESQSAKQNRNQQCSALDMGCVF